MWILKKVISLFRPQQKDENALIVYEKENTSLKEENTIQMIPVDTNISYTNKSYDISLLKSVVGNGAQGINEIIGKFIEKMPSELDDLEQAVLNGNMYKVAAQAHKLKANLKLFGLDTIYADLGAMERIGKGEDQSSDTLQQHMDRVKDVFERALAELPQELNGANSSKRNII